MKRFSHLVDVSTELYFTTLLQFLQVSWLQFPILRGVVHSIASGTEDLMRVSRLALLNSFTEDSAYFGALQLQETLVSLLEDSYTDDRQAVPILETIAFVMEQCPPLASSKCWNEKHGTSLEKRISNRPTSESWKLQPGYMQY
jgi:tubulin-specific chaperone D